MRTEPEKMIQNARDLVKHRANVLRTYWHFDLQELFYRHHVRMLIAHHGDIIETVHVRNRLEKSLLFGEFFGCPVQQTYMRIGTLDHFAVQLEHQAQHPMRRRMLRPEVHGVVANIRHGCQFPAVGKLRRKKAPLTECYPVVHIAQPWPVAAIAVDRPSP